MRDVSKRLAWALLLTSAGACSEEGISKLIPKIKVDPEQLQLGGIAFGETGRLPLTIEDEGSGALAISAIDLVGTGTAAPSADLALSVERPVPLSLAPAQRLVVEVAYIPRDLILDTGAVRIRSDDPDRPEVLVPIVHGVQGAPRVVAVPDVQAAEIEARTPGGIGSTITSIPFGQVNLGQSVRRTAFLVNSGDGDLPLAVRSVKLRDVVPSLSLTVQPTAPLLLAALRDQGLRAGVERSIRVDLAYAPTRTNESIDTALLVETNDPATPTLVIPITGSTESLPPPAMRVSPIALDFGSVRVGMSASRLLTVENTGGSPLPLDALALSSTTGAFALEQAPAAVSIPAGQMRSFGVRFTPARAGPDRGGVVQVRAETAMLPPVDVPLIALGTTEPVGCTPTTTDPQEPANDQCASAYDRGTINLGFGATETRTWNSSQLERMSDEDWSVYRVAVDAGCDFVGYQFTARVSWPGAEQGEVCMHVGDCTAPDRGPRCASGSSAGNYFALDGGALCNGSGNAVPVYIRVRHTGGMLSCMNYSVTFTAR